MFSGALAGALRVGAVLVTTGAMAGGVYFVVQVGERDDATQFQAQATATTIAGEQLSPPNQIGEPPGPIPTPPAIDTSDWLTYESPLGFTIKYPPGWVVETYDDPEGPRGHARIIDTRTLDAFETNTVVMEGGTVIIPKGFTVAWIDIDSASSPSQFDIDEHLRRCEPKGQSEVTAHDASVVTFAGRPAVRCFAEGPSADGEFWARGESYTVSLASGRIMTVIVPAYNADQTTVELVKSIPSTLSFEAVP